MTCEMSPWQLSIKDLQGSTMSIRVNRPENATILDLKRLITQQDGTLPVFEQRLVIRLEDGGKTELDDSKKMFSYHDIRRDSEIILIRTLPFQLFVKGMDGTSYCIVVPSKTPETYSVASFKRLLQERTGLRPEEQRLQFGGKELVDRNTLGDYGLVSNNTLHLVSRLRGGMAITGRCVVRNCYTTTYRMPCGHSVSSSGLYDHCMSKIRSGRDRVACPVCSRGWSVKDLRESGNLSETQVKAIDDGLTQNFFLSMPGVIKCKGCGSIWSSHNAASGELCSSCAVKCHDGKKATVELLAKCPMKTIDHASNCPSLRACPKCGNVIEHQEACRRVECNRCKTLFCFICLMIRTSSCSNYYACASNCGTAARQTFIPEL